MKCSSKSTRSFVSGSLWLVLLTAPLYGGPSTSADAATIGNAATAAATRLTAAIEAAVRARIGGTSVVSVATPTGVRLLHDSSSLVAVPDASARIGTPVRFVLASGSVGARTRLGEATALVQVTAPAVRTRK